MRRPAVIAIGGLGVLAVAAFLALGAMHHLVKHKMLVTNRTGAALQCVSVSCGAATSERKPVTVGATVAFELTLGAGCAPIINNCQAAPERRFPVDTYWDHMKSESLSVAFVEDGGIVSRPGSL